MFKKADTTTRHYINSLLKGSEDLARATSIAGEALAQTRSVVALSTTATLVRIVVSQAKLGDIGEGISISRLQRETINLGRASVSTLVVLHKDHVLGSLYTFPSEGDVNGDNAKLFSIQTVVGGNSDAIDDSVGEIQQRQLNIVHKIREIVTLEYNGNGGESLVQLGAESQSESLSIKSGITGSKIGSLEIQILNLILGGDQKVVTNIQNIGGVRAHALGAINIAVGCVTDASTDLGGIPVMVVKSLHRRLGAGVNGPSLSNGHILYELAGSVSGAVIGTGGALAALAIVAVEALTFA
jgi:hypothetical protein